MPTTRHPVAVFDVETTGFSDSDRIIEIGIVTFDAAGNETRRYETLVQPYRDIPNSRVHGITATMVVDAPVFADVAKAVASVLDSHVLVAHNAAFDLRMLRAEFSRLGIHWDDYDNAVFDTMTWSKKLLPGAPAKLADALAACGIENPQAHRALTDASATAQLFFELLARGAQIEAQPARLPAPLIEHPLAPALPRPVNTGQAETDAYQRVLIDALDDHVITEEERNKLVATAAQLGLTADEAAEVHRSMLGRMAVMAWADGVLTKQEAQLLRDAARSLQVPDEDLEEMLTPPAEVPNIRLIPGGRIVFTGELELPRAVWEEKVTSLGYTVGGITRKTSVLVAADPQSQSGKARKARHYGVPIISEAQLTWLIQHPAEGAHAEEPENSTPAAELGTADLPNEDSSAMFPSIFPWLERSHSELTAVLEEWVREYPTDPLARLSPKLDPDSVPETLNIERTAIKRWIRKYPRPLHSSVEDLRSIAGVGPKSLADTLQAIALAALDSDVEEIYPGTTADTQYELTTDVYAPEQEPSTYTPELSAQLSDVQQLLDWWALCKRDCFSGLRAAPEEVQAAALRLEEFSHDHRLIMSSKVATQTKQLVIADERVHHIFLHRLLSLSPETLEAIGSRFQITRERVRQLEKKTLNDLREVLNIHLAALPQRVLRPIHRDTLLKTETDLATEVLPGIPLVDVLVAVSDEVILDRYWVEPRSARSTFTDYVTEKVDEYGVVAWELLSDFGPVSEDDRRRWVSEVAAEWVVRDGVVFTRTNNSADRAVAILSQRGEPMTGADLVDYIGHGSRRSMDNALTLDDRTHRTALGTWSLVAWGGEEFTNVSEWISSRVDAEGGYPLNALISEAANVGVSESTIRTYSNNGEFITKQGTVSRNNEDVVVQANPEEYADMFIRDGEWQLLITVNSEHLRGSGFAVPRCLAGIFDVPFLGRRSFTSSQGEQELRFGRTNVTTGTIRRFLTAMDASEGDRMWLRFSHDGTFTLSRATARTVSSGVADILNSCGVDDRTEDLAGLNAALGLAADAPRRRTVSRFNHRGQENIAEAIRAL